MIICGTTMVPLVEYPGIDSLRCVPISKDPCKIQHISSLISSKSIYSSFCILFRKRRPHICELLVAVLRTPYMHSASITCRQASHRARTLRHPTSTVPQTNSAFEGYPLCNAFSFNPLHHELSSVRSGCPPGTPCRSACASPAQRLR